MSDKTVEMPLDLARDSVNIAARAGELCEKIAADMTVVEGKASLVADTLIKNGVLDAIDKQRTVEMLKDPKQAMDILCRVSDLAAQPRSMGHAEKQADVWDPQNSSKKESDRIFEEKLGRMSA